MHINILYNMSDNFFKYTVKHVKIYFYIPKQLKETYHKS